MSDESHAGKSRGLADEILKRLLGRRGRDHADRPLLGGCTRALIDPHGAMAQELVARLAKVPDAKPMFDDLNEFRLCLGFDPLRLQDQTGDEQEEED